MDVAAGFVGATCAGFAPSAGAAITGLADGAVPEPAPELWPNAEAVASIVAMATIVILRMSDALGMMRPDGAEFEKLDH